MRRAGKLFVLSTCGQEMFQSICFVQPGVLSLWMPSAESHLSLLNSVGRSAERFCEGELCCFGHRRKTSVLCLLYKIYHRADDLLHEYVHHFVAARNISASAALCELALVIPRCRTDQFSRSFFARCCAAVELCTVGCV